MIPIIDVDTSLIPSTYFTAKHYLHNGVVYVKHGEFQTKHEGEWKFKEYMFFFESHKEGADDLGISRQRISQLCKSEKHIVLDGIVYRAVFETREGKIL